MATASGWTCRSPPPWRLRRPADDLRTGSNQRPGDSSTGASGRPRTSTSRSSTEPSSSSSSTGRPFVNDSASGSPRSWARGAPRLRHGLHRDRQPGVPPAVPRAPSHRGPALGGALTRRGHHPDRARVRRRAHVRDLASWDYSARLEIRQARLESVTLKLAATTSATVDRRAARHRDLRAPRSRTCWIRSSASASRSRRGGGCWSRRPRLLLRNDRRKSRRESRLASR